MSDLHPDRYGQIIDSNVTTHGRNRNDGVPSEHTRIRCKKCGMTMSKVTRPKGWGQGRSQVSTQISQPVNAGATTINVDSTADFPTPVTGSITAFASNGTLGTKVTSAAHGLKGGKVTITSTTNYNGVFYIQDVLTNSFVIAKSYVANDATGTWTIPETIYIYDSTFVLPDA